MGYIRSDIYQKYRSADFEPKERIIHINNIVAVIDCIDYSTSENPSYTTISTKTVLANIAMPYDDVVHKIKLDLNAKYSKQFVEPNCYDSINPAINNQRHFRILIRKSEIENIVIFKNPEYCKLWENNDKPHFRTDIYTTGVCYDSRAHNVTLYLTEDEIKKLCF